MAHRKYIRIALTQEDFEWFGYAKDAAEEATGIAMSDSMFALSVIRQAVKHGSLTEKLKSEKKKGYKSR